jgi:virginiamycin B lyase
MTGFAGVRRLIVIGLAAAGATLCFAAPALAAPQVDGEFSVSGVGSDNAITTGPDDNIWLTVQDATNDVARITPEGAVQEFDLPDIAGPVGIASQGGRLWVTRTNGVASFAPGSPTTTDEAFTSATMTDARGITRGPDGNLWAVSGANVVKIVPAADPATPPTFTGFPVLVGGRQIVAGGNGNLWATDFNGDRIVSVTTAGAPAPGSPYNGAGDPQGIAAGPGNQIAFVDQAGRVGRITPGGAPQFRPIAGTDPFGVGFGADGAYWIAQFATNNLGRLTPSGQYSTLGGFTAGSGPRELTRGPNNTLWVTLDTSNKVARVTGVAPPSPPPPPNGCTDNAFEFGKAKKNKKKGTAKLPVTVPCAGDVELAKTKKVKADEETADAEGDVTLLIKPKGKARKRLSKKGKAKVKAEVTYTPTGGEPNTQTKKIKLKRKRR